MVTEINEAPLNDTGRLESPNPESNASSAYVKPYISVRKHGENGQLFEPFDYDDRYKTNKGRNYH